MRRLLLATALIGMSLGCSSASSAAKNDPRTLSDAFQSLADTTSAGVVHIVATGYVARPQGAVGLVERARAVGAGFVLERNGVIVTNAHVVLGAERIDVTVLRPVKGKPDARERARLKARIIGLDADSDLALLKVEAEGLHALSLGDADKVRPGQLVFAFGSPLGLEGSMSMGIVGATDRQPDPDDPLVFIQTDAAINPGNSGGPLVNASGEVIGVNTLIASTSGGNQGLGFAVPSDIVAQIARQLREDGRVWHGTLGLAVQSVTPILANDLGLSRAKGALVTDIAPGGPSDGADVEVGDIVVRLDRNPIESGRELNARVHNIRPGRKATLVLVRGKEEVETVIRADALPGDPRELLGSVDPRQHLVPKLRALGLTVDPGVRQALPGLRAERGVLIVDTDFQMAGPNEGLDRGDVIVSVAKREVRDLDDLNTALAGYPTGTMVILRVERRGRFSFVMTELE